MRVAIIYCKVCGTFCHALFFRQYEGVIIKKLKKINKMSDWLSQLNCISNYIPGCAIVALTGEVCASCGICPTSEEMHDYTYFFADDVVHHPLMYAREDKYFVNMMTPVKVLAMHGANAIALHRTNKLYVGGFSDGRTISTEDLMKLVTALAEYLAENGL